MLTLRWGTDFHGLTRIELDCHGDQPQKPAFIHGNPRPILRHLMALCPWCNGQASTLSGTIRQAT